MAAFSLQDLDQHLFPCFSTLEKAGFCNNESFLSYKWGGEDSSSGIESYNKVEVGEQVTQKRVLSSSNSMDGNGVKSKRQRKSTCVRNEDKEKKLDKKVHCKKVEMKISEEAPIEYVHVRAKRGQATDSHSLAERVRREKISERMKTLQSLVPGCDKITGKALMLDEIINYVQSLQNQVEFLSSKLACLNPFLGFEMENDNLIITPQAERLNDESVPIFSATITDNYPLLDHATSAHFFDPQIRSPNIILTQDDGQALWDVILDEQRLLNNEFGFMNNNLCSFQ